MKNEYKYMVMTRCYTFNHAAYIKDALDGFCMQETTFPFVCAVVDDASTDGELDILRQYLAEHFDLEDKTVVRRDETEDYERVFAQHKENRNCFFVMVFLKYNHYSIKKTKGPYVSEWKDQVKYIALCEGDDYWIHPKKLQMQVEFMESNPEYGLCYTGVGVKNQKTGEVKMETPYKHLQTIEFWQLLIKNRIETLSVVFRQEMNKKYIHDIKPATHNWKMSDYPMWLWFSKESKIKRLELTTSIYRIVQGSSTHDSNKEAQVEFLKSVMDIKNFFMDYYHLMDNEKKIIVHEFVNSSLKTALLKKNRLMYDYAISLKNKEMIGITTIDKICGFLLSHKIGLRLIDVYLRTRVDSI